MRKIIFITYTILIATSCQDYGQSLSPPDSGNNIPEEIESPYAISPEDALNNLNEFLESDPVSTRSSIKRQASSISPIKTNRLPTRVNAGNMDCDNIIYIANFQDDQGYAILAADNRIPEKIIAVTDEGSLDDYTVYSALDLENEERTIFDGYPTDGSGFITFPEYGDEVFMHPNTVVLYDETEGDTRGKLHF